MSGVIEELKQLTDEDLQNMSEEELDQLNAKIALAFIKTNARFLEVALDSGKLDTDDTRKIRLCRAVLEEILQKCYPNREW